MKAKSKWMAILLVLGLIIAACGDGGGEDDTTTTAAPAVDTTEAPTETTEAPTETTEGEMAEIATDVGVDLDAGTISVGLLSDLTGPFSPLVQVIVAGHDVYWENVNAAGGINGLEVVLNTVDTAYEVPSHVQRYEELKDEVVALGHSTGSPHTVAINNDLQADGILAIPLTWYSGWTDPEINSNLLHHGINYCVEAHNVIGYISETMDDISTIAVVTWPGDYGLDGAIGAVQAAEAAGLEIVYDGSGTVIPGDESTLTEAANAVVGSGADMVYVVTNPTDFASIFGQAIAGGYEGLWTGAGPSWNPALLGSPIAEAVAASTIWSGYYGSWSSDAPGVADAKEQVEAAGVLERPNSAILEGFVEAMIMHAALEAAYQAGDMTQAGVLAAAKSLENVDLNGLGPNETYVGDANTQLQRVSASIFQPDLEGFTSGENGGETLLVENYTSGLTADYDFTGACFVLEN
jgi:ABC-type branched-subunit amino acid transport system substrate-binding protein